MSANPNELDILYVSPERFRKSPQVGVPCKETWEEWTLYLSRVTRDIKKDAAGAWSPALYAGNVRRKSSLISVGMLTVDIDIDGDVSVITGLLGQYKAIVHETFSSTICAPRCRAVILFDRRASASEYEIVHGAVRTALLANGIATDPAAKDASRLCYSPVRKPGDSYAFRIACGKPLNVDDVLSANPPVREHLPPIMPAAENKSRYLAAALDNAAREIATCAPGQRHDMLLNKVFKLAKLGMWEAEIAAVLVPAFVACAGQARAHEASRSIRDVVMAAQRGGTVEGYKQ